MIVEKTGDMELADRVTKFGKDTESTFSQLRPDATEREKVAWYEQQAVIDRKQLLAAQAAIANCTCGSYATVEDCSALDKHDAEVRKPLLDALELIRSKANALKVDRFSDLQDAVICWYNAADDIARVADAALAGCEN